MAVFDTFSRRLARLAAGGRADPLVYDALPRGFLAQVVHIWSEALGPYHPPSDPWIGLPDHPTTDIWPWIAKTAAKEVGVFALTDDPDPAQQCAEYLVQADDVGAKLDLIEISFVAIDQRMRMVWKRHGHLEGDGVTLRPDDAIEELNARFQQHSLGYQFAGGQLIRLDSQYIHGQVVEPALRLLHTSGFAGAEQEYLSAHEHYRHGRFKEAMNDALKAFESTMKTICLERGWPHPATATASQLIGIVFDQGLVAPPMRSYFDSVRSALESGLGTLRNKMSAHGQGASVKTVPRYLAAHALHLAAANILLLVEAHLAR